MTAEPFDDEHLAWALQLDDDAGQLPDPRAVQIDEDDLEVIRAGRMPRNADRLHHLLGAWRDRIARGET